MTSAAVKDMTSHPVVTANAQQASKYIADTTSPVMSSYSLNMNSSTIVLTFNEIVLPSTFNISAIRLQNARTSYTSYSLTSGTVSTLNDVSVVVFLSWEDANNIKAFDSIAKFQSSTFLSYDVVISDVKSNKISPLSPTVALSVLGFTPDSIRPFVTSVTLDLQSNILYVNFSETVRGAAVSVSGISLETADYLNYVPLNDSVSSTVPSYSLRIFLSVQDRNNIKLQPSLRQSSIAIFSDYSVADMQNNSLVPFSSMINYFSPDQTPPILVSFTINMNLGLLVLSFSEPVNAASLVLTSIHFQSRQLGDALTLSRNLTGGSVLSGNGLQITALLTLYDMNKIKATYGLLVSNFTSFISISSDFAADMSSNQINPILSSYALQTTFFTRDTTSPIIQYYNLDLTQKLITLYFSETVNLQSFQPTQLVLQSKSNGTSIGALSYRLTNTSNVTALDESTFQIKLSNSDFDNIQLSDGIATSRAAAWMSYSTNLVADMSGNQLTPTLSTSAMQASNYTADTMKPTLLSFELNMDSRVLVFHFSEAVRVSNFQVTSCSLQATPSFNDSFTGVTLQAATVLTGNNKDVSIQFSVNDANIIKTLPMLCTAVSNCYISIGASAITDMASNSLVRIQTSNAQQVLNYSADVTRPTFASFSLNMNTGLIVLTFDETINALTAQASSIWLQNTASASNAATSSFRLTGGVFSTINSTVLSLQLTTADMNEIKRIGTLAINESTSFLYITQQAVQDMRGLPVNPVTKWQAMPITAGQFVADTTPPQLLAFTLNMSSQQLLMTFDETMRAKSTVLTRVSFVSWSSSNIYQLQAGSVISNDSTVVTIALDQNDVNAIKLDTSLATSDNNTQIMLSTGAFQDMVGNPLQATTTTVTPGGFTRDSIPPQLVAFALNMNTSTLTLNFNEPVNSSSVRLDGQLVVSNAVSAMPANIFTLNGGIASSMNGMQLTVVMTLSDSNNIKINRALLVSKNSSYLSLSTAFVKDMAGNAIVPISVTNALGAASYVQDDTSPVATGFDLDMTLGLLTLYFSETVDALTLNATGITLQTSSAVSGAGASQFSLQLTSGHTGPAPGPNITIQLGTADMNELKRKQIALQYTTSWVTMTPAVVLSMTGVASVAIINSLTTLRVSVYVPDSVPPTLQSAALSMYTGQLSLTFSETVRALSLNASWLTLQSSSVQGSVWYTLALCSGTSSMDSTSLRLDICTDDLNAIKVRFPLASSLNTSFLSLGGGFLTDMMNIPITAISVWSGLQVSSYTADTIRPSLVAFDFDMQSGPGVLTLYFDETVDGSTLNVTSIVLQASSTVGLGVSVYQLTGGAAATTRSTVIAINITQADSNMIKGLPGLCKSALSTFLTFGSNLVRDVYGNIVNSQAGVSVRSYTVDIEPPKLVSFAVNLTSRVVRITFSETVQTASVQPWALTFWSSSCGGRSYQLTGGTVVGALAIDSPSVLVTLTQEDLNAIEFEQQVLMSVSTSFLSAAAVAVLDVAGNQLQSPLLCALPGASIFGVDTVAPRVISLDVDMDSGVLFLLFSKTINFATFISTSVLLSSGPNATNVSYRLVSTVALNTSSTSCQVYLAYNDLDFIKSHPPLCTSAGTCSLFTDPTIPLVRDYFSNPMAPISLSTARTALSLVPDTTPVSIRTFNLDMTAQILTLVFMEPINISTLDPTHITFQLDPIEAIPAVPLATSVVISSGYSAIASIRISSSDFNNIALFHPLASAVNAVFLRADGGLCMDMTGNKNVPFTALPASNFTPDTVRPQLSSFSFDMSLGLVVLSFSETVDFTSFNLSKLSVQDSASLSSGSKQWSFSQSQVLPRNGPVIYLNISLSDLNNIKRIRNLARSINTTFLSVISNSLSDMCGNGVVPISSSTALKASVFTTNLVRPRLTSWDMYMNPLGPPLTLLLHFSETVDLTTLRLNGISLQDRQVLQAANQSFTLTNGSAIAIPDSP